MKDDFFDQLSCDTLERLHIHEEGGEPYQLNCTTLNAFLPAVCFLHVHARNNARDSCLPAELAVCWLCVGWGATLACRDRPRKLTHTCAFRTTIRSSTSHLPQLSVRIGARRWRRSAASTWRRSAGWASLAGGASAGGAGAATVTAAAGCVLCIHYFLLFHFVHDVGCAVARGRGYRYGGSWVRGWALHVRFSFLLGAEGRRGLWVAAVCCARGCMRPASLQESAPTCAAACQVHPFLLSHLHALTHTPPPPSCVQGGRGGGGRGRGGQPQQQTPQQAA